MKVKNAMLYGKPAMLYGKPATGTFRFMGGIEDLEVIIAEHEHKPTFYEPATKAEFSCVVCGSATREQTKLNRFFRAMMGSKRKVVKWRGKKMLVSKQPQALVTIRMPAGMGKTPLKMVKNRA